MCQRVVLLFPITVCRIGDTDFFFSFSLRKSGEVEEGKKKSAVECRESITRTCRVLRVVSNVRVVHPTSLDLETTSGDSREVSPWVNGAADSKTRPVPAVTSPRCIAP